MDPSQFAWTFPVYILAKNYTMDGLSESVVFDDRIRFATPEITPNGPRAIALFTDLDMAREFQEESPDKLDAVPFTSPAALRAFLERARNDYSFVAVDVNRKTRRGAICQLEAVIQEMNHLEQG